MPAATAPNLGAAAGGQIPFLGSVPSGKAAPGAIDLSLADAISRGLQYNLGPILFQQGERAALGARWRALSGLLPAVVTRTSETSQQINLKALGFSGFPGATSFNPIVGPFEVFDTRAILSQQVLNFTAIFNNRAGSENLRAARLSLQDARDTTVLVVVNLYLAAVAASSRVDAAQAQLNTAETVYQRAVNMRSAGVVPGIEVLRAQVQRQAQQQRLIFYRNEFEKQKLNLGRAIGLPDGQQFRLTDQVPYAPVPAVAFEDALRQAFTSRSDYLSAAAQVNAAELLRRAATSQRLPSVSLDANYGTIGPTPLNSHGTYAVTGALNIPIFQGGRVRADVIQADAQLQQRRAELEDLRGRISNEIRTAFLDIKAAGEQVDVARSAVNLADQALTQAQDRFSAGVTSNLEVVQAQEAVATANENLISSLYAFNVSKAALARALGSAEKNWKQFLGGTH